MKCDASWPWDACKIDRFRIDVWTHTSAEPSTVPPFARGRGQNERSLPATSTPSWAGKTAAVVRQAEVAVVRPRQDPLGWEADRSAAGDHAPR